MSRTVRHHIAILDRLAALFVAIGTIMAASGAFTLCFQASGIGYAVQSVLALVLGCGLTATGFHIAGRARSLDLDLRMASRSTEGLMARRRGPHTPWTPHLVPALRALPSGR